MERVTISGIQEGRYGAGLVYIEDAKFRYFYNLAAGVDQDTLSPDYQLYELTDFCSTITGEVIVNENYAIPLAIFERIR